MLPLPPGVVPYAEGPLPAPAAQPEYLPLAVRAAGASAQAARRVRYLMLLGARAVIAVRQRLRCVPHLRGSGEFEESNWFRA